MRVTHISVVLRHTVLAKVQVTYTLDNQDPTVVVLLTTEITLLLRLTLSLVMTLHSLEEVVVLILVL